MPTANHDEVRALVARIVDGLVGDGLIGDGLIGDGLIGDGLVGDGLMGDGLAGADRPQVGEPQPTVATDVPRPTRERIAIGADHGGYALKERLAFRLREAGHEVIDCGTHSHDPVDYPDIALAVAREVAGGSCAAGIVIDGAGIGSSIAANKVPGVRAALCYDISSARNSREHNHANVLTLGAGLIGEALAWQIVEEWLATEWGPDRHARRVAKIAEIERTYATVATGAP